MLHEVNKKCSICKENLSIQMFNKHRGKKDGLQTACRHCLKIQAKLWDSNPLNRRGRKLQKKYGISNEMYDTMLVEQDFKCKICDSSDTRNKSTKYLVVDHDHKTGNIRGLLCDYCNVGLGRFEDDIKRLEKAIMYLKGSNHD